MAEFDPTDALHDMARAGAREARPLEAGEIRRRGQRMRRTRQATAAAGAALAVTGVAALALLGPANLLGGDRAPVAAPPSPSVTPTGDLELALLTPADLPADQGWTSRALTTPMVCGPDLQGWFTRDLAPEGGEGGGLRHGIDGPYPTADDAAAAVRVIRDQVDTCLASTRPVNLTDAWEVTGVNGFAMRWWGAETGDRFGSRELVTLMVASTGRAVTVLSWGGPAQDANMPPQLDEFRTALGKLCGPAAGDCSKSPTGLVRTFPAPPEDPAGLLTADDVSGMGVPIAGGADEPAFDNVATVCAETPLAGAASSRGRGFGDEELVSYLYEAVGTYANDAAALRAMDAIAAGYADCPDSAVPVAKVADGIWTLRFGDGANDTLTYVGAAQSSKDLVVLQWTTTVEQGSDSVFAAALSTAVERLGA